jgi:hypothetical protein
MSALRIFTDYLYTSIDKRKGKAVAIFVDLKKAFDSVDQSFLIQNLMTEYEIEPWYVTIINEVFRNRVFRVGNDDKYYCMPRGVCQGSALGPLLFSMHINSVGSCFSSPFLLYADDLVLYDNGTDETVIINKLAIQLDKLCDWCELNGVNINFDKTNFMIFHKERDRSCSSDINKITVRNENIDGVFSFKYLGLWFDPNLNFTIHYNSVLKKW